MTRIVAEPRLPDPAERAAVRVSFDLSNLGADEDLDGLMTFLDESCVRIRTPSGAAVWSLTDDERRRCFARVPLRRLRAARAAAEDVEDSVLQTTLDRSLRRGWTPSDLAALTPAEARALCVVAAWWDGRRSGVPDVPTANRIADRLNLFADARAMAADHFTDRASVLRELRDHFASGEPLPFAMYGLGGIGKSALVARHVVWAVDDPDGPHAYAAVLDFDDATLNPVRQLDIVHRIVNRIARQADDEVRRDLERLGQVSLDAVETSAYLYDSSSRTGSTGGSARPLRQLVNGLVTLARRPVLVVFDTVEHVPRRGPSAIAAFTALVEMLAGFRSRLRVVVSGRAEVPGLPARSREITGLDVPDAIDLLTALCGRPVDPGTADAVVGALGTSPLTIRLAARLLSDPDTVAGDLIALDLHAERINAELYRRVLARIRDDEVRRLAHPGLVLRRVTKEIIAEVLAKPCKVEVPDDTTAQDLFERLAREVMLVERTKDRRTLIHRADVRQMMLPQLLADRGDVARRIQRAAIRYYADRHDPVSRTEELYQRLLLGQRPATLDAHWDARAAESLMGVMDELPTRSRIHLARRLPETYLSLDDRRLVDDARWLEEIEPQVVRLLAAGEPARTLDLLSERRGPDGSSLLPALEIEAREALGDLPRAAAMARDGRRAASIANDLTGVTTYTLHLARLEERLGDRRAAGAAIEEALRTARKPTVERLRLLVALLALWRRQGYPIGAEDLASRRAETVRLHDLLPEREIRRVPGLLRDLAAEVSGVQPTILDDALGAIGIDASATGLIPRALRELDDTMAAERGSPGIVADLAQLDRTADDVAWDGIVSKPRGETGRALLEVFRTSGPSADGLRSAVVDDYQHEADAALFGLELDIGPKR